ncbi:MAG: ABC transporter permease [Aristaeellaceae bacterium]
MATLFRKKDRAALHAPYQEIRGSGVNRLLSLPARILICLLAVMLFLCFTNPGQTALLGRASHIGLALFGDGLDELRAVDKVIDGTVNALDNACAGIQTAMDGLSAVNGNMTTAKNALKTAQDAMTAAQTALDRTLGAEAAACDAVLAQSTTAIESFAIAAEKIPVAISCYDAAKEAAAAAEAAQSTANDVLMSLWLGNSAMDIPTIGDGETIADGLDARLVNVRIKNALTVQQQAMGKLQAAGEAYVKATENKKSEAKRALREAMRQYLFSGSIVAAMDEKPGSLHELQISMAQQQTVSLDDAVEVYANALMEAYTKDQEAETAAMAAENAVYDVLMPFYTVVDSVPSMKTEADGMIASLYDMMAFASANESDPDKWEKILAVLTEVSDQVVVLNQRALNLQTSAEQKKARIAPVMTEATVALENAVSALKNADASVKNASNAQSKADKTPLNDALRVDADAKIQTAEAAKEAAAAMATQANEAVENARTAMNDALTAKQVAATKYTQIATTVYSTLKSGNEAASSGVEPIVNEAEAARAEAEDKLGEANVAITAAESKVEAYKSALADAEAKTTEAKAATDKLDTAENLNADAEARIAEAEESISVAVSKMQAASMALTAADQTSVITNVAMPGAQDGMIRLSSALYTLGILVGLVGLVMSLGNNRMRRTGMPVLAAGALVSVAGLLLTLNAHGRIAERIAAMEAGFGWVELPADYTAAVAKLALDVPAALWSCLVMAVLTAGFAVAAWLTLPRQVEELRQLDLLTIFQRLTRVLILVTGMMVFLPSLNPGRISALINENTSLFTVATSYGTITNKLKFALDRGIIDSSLVVTLMIGAALVMLGIILNSAGACMSLGNNRMKKKGGYLLPMAGSMVIITGLVVILFVYNSLVQVTVKTPSITARIQPMLPGGIVFWAVSAVLVFICSFVSWQLLPDEIEEKMEMEEKYRNFLMFLPVLLLTFVFCYLPIYGWRFAFFDYKIGDPLLLYDTVVDGAVTQTSNFTGFKWFAYLFENSATRNDLLRVLRNTLIMSGLGIATSWFPIAFAVLLAEVRSTKFQRVVQTLTTIPNFISWVLVYAIAFAIFSTDGFINSFLRNVMGIAGANTDYLASADWTWIKMLLWGTWKGLGWSAIVYIAGIAGIDQQLYEAARVDGANRFQCIRHITIPGLMPTYMVMLLMSVAGMLSNGMDQYLVFSNAINTDVIEVLDLYVYNIGIKSELYPLSTVVGVFKSLIGVTLLFGANSISKAVRGESII